MMTIIQDNDQYAGHRALSNEDFEQLALKLGTKVGGYRRLPRGFRVVEVLSNDVFPDVTLDW